MLTWVIAFLVIALVAAIFGYGEIVKAATAIAKVIFFIFILLFILSLAMHLGHFSFNVGNFKFSHN